MSKKVYNTKSYCHDCGKEIEEENFYCDECLDKNGLKKFNIPAFIIALIQPIAGIWIMVCYKKRLNPGIYDAAKMGVIIFALLFVISFIIGFIQGVLGI